MVDQRGFKAETRALQQHHANIGTPFTGAHALDMAYQVQRMAFVDRVSAASLFYQNSVEAPIAEASAVNTDSRFFINDKSNTKDYELGWLAHPNASKLKCVLYVAMGATDLQLRISMTTKTLDPGNTVTTTQSERFDVVPVGRMPRAGKWSHHVLDIDHPPFSLGVCSIVHEPDYPADRTAPYAIAFDAYWHAPTNPDNISNTRRACLQSVRLWDVVIPPNPES